MRTVIGILVAGHGVASGQGVRDRRFPEGTIRMQAAFFRTGGLDLAAYFTRPFTWGTLNLRCETGVVAIRRPDFVFRDVTWTALLPAENFYLARGTVTRRGRAYRGLLYLPDPATKPDHFHDPRVVEVIAETIPGIALGDAVALTFDPAAIEIA
jgi:hypothetical protein